MMPVFYFRLRDGNFEFRDDQGQELPDLAAARAYAVQVARELIRKSETEKRHCRLDVYDERDLVAEVPFATVDPTLDHLSLDLRQLVERICETRREFAETLSSLEFLILRLRQMRGLSNPYLVAQDGRQIR
jgi:hypothetical protein